MDTTILKDIGFTNAEIKIYISLLGLGTATAGPIIDKSGLQNSVVHMILNKLIEKGLVSYIKVGKVNHYQASNPSNIGNMIDERKTRFNKLLPQLISKQNGAKEKPEVITFRGIKGIKELLMILLEAGGNEHHTFGSSEKSLMLGEGWWVDYHKKRGKKKIKAKLIFNKSLIPFKAEKKYPDSIVRYTKEGFEPLTETIIRNDKIGIIIWTEKPIGTLIHQKEAARSYDNFFEVLWKSAKK